MTSRVENTDLNPFGKSATLCTSDWTKENVVTDGEAMALVPTRA
jgi:hypothetical protein